MSNYYDLEGIKNELKKRIDINQCFLAAWKNVEFCTKKDGTYFKNISKNFENAKYGTKNYCTVYENELTVYVCTKL